VASESDAWVRPDWWDLANCRGRHDLLSSFVPDAQTHDRRACQKVPAELARLCAECPVNLICYESGFRDRYAIRGGTTASQRDAIIRKERRDARAS